MALTGAELAAWDRRFLAFVAARDKARKAAEKES
jgi:hypothetical protein